MMPLNSLTALLIDHDDSFTQNLKFWLNQKFSVEIISNQQLDTFSSVDKFDLVVFSAGPRAPHDYIHSLNWLRTHSTTRILGICLGFQMMTIVENGAVATYSPVLHGKTSSLTFTDVDKILTFPVARYHSLHCQPDANFKQIAISSDDHKLMWAEHKTKPWLGWQFHPESFLTEDQDYLINYLEKWVQL